MKRLIFCFDGTWNKLIPDLATNVVLTAASIERTDRSGVAQIIHYDEGVGTGDLDSLRGGMFGTGLIDNVREAYRFLIFNYDLGDGIYVFDFSRGAYSARSFIGFLRHVGPLRRLHAGRINEALELYENRTKKKKGAIDALRRFRATYAGTVCIGSADDQWRCSNVPGYLAGSAPELRIKFLGAWDTVGAMGVPGVIPFSDWLNRDHDFHDASIDSFVESARHAVALDERRELFPPITLGDLNMLNEQVGFAAADPKAPYQERWFPGDHGSIGGGGDIRGLSDDALSWVLTGAKRAGLQLDTNEGTRIHGFRPDPMAPLVNVKKPAFSATRLLEEDRDGPEHLWQVAPSALRRWRAPAALPGGKPYRPGSLRRVEQRLADMGPWHFVPPTDLLATETVRSGDTLSGLAARHYGDAELWPIIVAANADVIDDPNEIFPGQTLRITRSTALPS